MTKTTLATTILLTIANTSFAQENLQNFPGAACVKDGSSGVLGIREGRVRNESTTAPLTLTCPIARQSLSDGGLASGGEVWVIDDSATSDVQCQVQIQNLASDVVEDRAPFAVSPGRDSSTPVSLTIPNLATPFDLFDVAHIRCLLPPVAAGQYSYLLGVVVRERGLE